MTDLSTARERRITLRLLAYWERLRGDKQMPREEDIDPEDIRDLWESCFLIHIKDLDKPDYNYTFLGNNINSAYYGDLSKDDQSAMISPHADKLAGVYSKVIESGKPLVEEGEFTNSQGQLVKFRQCLLPLGGPNVDAIFGGMHFKIFS